MNLQEREILTEVLRAALYPALDAPPKLDALDKVSDAALREFTHDLAKEFEAEVPALPTERAGVLGVLKTLLDKCTRAFAEENRETTLGSNSPWVEPTANDELHVNNTFQPAAISNRLLRYYRKLSGWTTLSAVVQEFRGNNGRLRYLIDMVTELEKQRFTQSNPEASEQDAELHIQREYISRTLETNRFDDPFILAQRNFKPQTDISPKALADIRNCITQYPELKPSSYRIALKRPGWRSLDALLGPSTSTSNPPEIKHHVDVLFAAWAQQYALAFAASTEKAENQTCEEYLLVQKSGKTTYRILSPEAQADLLHFLQSDDRYAAPARRCAEKMHTGRKAGEGGVSV